MNELRIFTNEEFGQVRTMLKDNEPWFVAADVCRALEIDRTQTRRLDDDEKGVYSIQTPGGAQETTIVNEPGRYSLVLGSRKPEAKEFKRWITHEVIPSIRKHGMYMTGEALAYALSDPKNALELLTNYVKAQEQIKEQEQTIKIMGPKADYFDDLVDRALNTNFRTTAKELGIKERNFIRMLEDHGYVYRDFHGKIQPYAGKNNGLFVVKECKYSYSDGAGTQTLITPKGRETFRLLVKRWKDEE